MLLFGVPVKGGAQNVDPVIYFSRQALAWTPWKLLLAIALASPAVSTCSKTLWPSLRRSPPAYFSKGNKALRRLLGTLVLLLAKAGLRLWARCQFLIRRTFFLVNYLGDPHSAGKEADTPLFDDVCGLACHVLSELGAKVTIKLEASLQLSQFQRTAEELRHILPTRADLAGVDLENTWLDADLSLLDKLPREKLKLESGLATLREWEPQLGMPRALHIYTDGSYGDTFTDGFKAVGWSFTVWADCHDALHFVGHASFHGASSESPYFLGEYSPSPLVGERLGIAWAIVWIIEHSTSFPGPYVLEYDCLNAGKHAFGEFLDHASDEESAALAEAVSALRVCMDACCHVDHRHVRAHEGTFPNELTDVLAKVVRAFPVEHDQRCLPTWPRNMVFHPLRDWAWRFFDFQVALPTVFALETEALRLQHRTSHEPVRVPQIATVDLARQASEETVALQMLFASINILTFRDEQTRAAAGQASTMGLRVQGRQAFVIHQLLERRVWIAGFQESRLPHSSTAHSQDYALYHSACTSRGQLGCSLWINKSIPYATVKDQHHYVKESHVSILGYGPRYLVASVVAPHLRILIVVAHCPYQGHGESPEEFWRLISKYVSDRLDGTYAVILTDSNGHVGSVQSSSIGGLGPEEENAPGRELHRFLADHRLWAPATFADTHQGPSTTWVGPSGAAYRLDFVCIPLEWQRGHISSWVWVDFDGMQISRDHRPALLECCFEYSLSTQPFVRRQCSPPLRVLSLSASDREEYYRQLGAAALPDWHLDVDDHYDGLLRVWRASWCQVHTADAPPRHNPYITEETLGIRDRRKGLLRYIAKEELAAKRVHLLAGFAAFILHLRGQAFQPEQMRYLWTSLRNIHVSIARALVMVRVTGKQLRSAVKSDRKRYLAELASRVGQCQKHDTKALFEAVRQAFPDARSRKHKRLRLLPMLCKEDGSPAQSNTEAERIWRDHFRQQEAGIEVTPSGYAQEATDWRRASTLVPAFDVSTVPSRTELEQVLLSLRPLKSPGPDGATPELFQCHPRLMARMLMPLMVKASLATAEPFLWKGGTLVTLAKRASQTFQTNDFRSILLASVPGKIFHKLARRRLLPVLQQHQSGLLAGTAAGIGPDTISLAVRASIDIARQSGCSWMTLFFDIKSAFYRLVRQTIVPGEMAEYQLVRLLSGLGATPEALSELRQLLEQAAAIPRFGANPHLVKLVDSLLQATWFTMTLAPQLVMTFLGSRPGDSAADIFFAFGLTCYLDSTEALLRERGLCWLPSPPQKTLLADDWAVAPDVTTAAWADDVVKFHATSSPQQLRDDMQVMAKTFLNRAASCGMRFSPGRDKTAFLVDRRTRQSWTALALPNHALDYIDIDFELGGESFRIPLVSAYCHLGGVVTESGSIDQELYVRNASARGVLRSLAHKLFANPAYDIGTRVALLRALAVSKLTYGSGCLTFSASQHKRRWHANYVHLWRSLFRLDRPEHGKPHSYEVLLVAGCPPPHLSLALARSSLLRRIICHGPRAVRYLLQVQWELHGKRSWLHQFVGDVRNVAEYVSSAKVLMQSADPIPMLVEQVQSQPSWWTLQIKKAVQGFHQDLQRWQQTPSRHGLLISPRLDFSCHICCASFALRKHLGAHMARTHRIVALPRHYTHVPWCPSCMTMSHSISRAQNHFKKHPECLQAVAALIPPLSMDEIHATERADTNQASQFRMGHWHRLQHMPKATKVFGPQALNADERAEWVSSDSDLDVWTHLFRPEPEDVTWVAAYLDSVGTREPARQQAVSFWEARPAGPAVISLETEGPSEFAA
ncbi:unnamed protein product [Symbiodinium natans]|uniref:C2H2-type domain-containing protein n=1 Tax=Symbiodinium natans TaxID=878477 RepID=A0A812H3J7_9DINO|nr:unnamed protein product [Symbiodinium natans]